MYRQHAIFIACVQIALGSSSIWVSTLTIKLLTVYIRDLVHSYKSAACLCCHLVNTGCSISTKCTVEGFTTDYCAMHQLFWVWSHLRKKKVSCDCDILETSSTSLNMRSLVKKPHTMLQYSEAISLPDPCSTEPAGQAGWHTCPEQASCL